MSAKDGAALEPLERKTWKEVPGLTVAIPLVPSPISKSFAVKVVSPLPPLATAKVPVMSEEAKLIAPLNKAPAAVERTGRAWLRLEIVVEPLAATWNKEEPEEEAMVNSGTLPG